MVSLSLAEAKDKLSAVVNDVTSTHEHYTITRNGRPVAVVLPVDDLESLEETVFWLEREIARLRAGEPGADGPDIRCVVIKALARRALEYQLAPSTAFAVWKFITGPLRVQPG